MEEKKRKGFKDKEAQARANKKYRSTASGKRNTAIAVCKSKCKKYILELATNEDIKTVEKWIEERKEKNKIF